MKQEEQDILLRDLCSRQPYGVKEYSFWSDGYFVCSIGEANPDTIRKHIENQG